MRINHIWHIREYQDLDFGMHIFPSKRIFIHNLKDPINHPIAITNDIFNHFQMSNNACVISDGVFPEETIPNISNYKSNYFLFVGRLEKAKGIKDAITAFIKFSSKYPMYELWIAGSCSNEKYKSELHQIVNNADLFDRVKFLGFHTDVYSLMYKATALIVPSRSEGFGYITAEAMLNGCLVIGNNTGGTKTQFDNGVKLTGEEIGLRYSCLSELTDALFHVVDKGSNYFFPMIERAQKTVLYSYTIEKNAEEIHKLYKDILNKQL